MGTFSGNAFDSGTFDVYVPLGWDADTLPRKRRPPSPARNLYSTEPAPPASHGAVVDQAEAVGPSARRRAADLPEMHAGPPSRLLSPDLTESPRPRRATREQPTNQPPSAPQKPAAPDYHHDQKIRVRAPQAESTHAPTTRSTSSLLTEEPPPNRWARKCPVTLAEVSPPRPNAPAVELLGRSPATKPSRTPQIEAPTTRSSSAISVQSSDPPRQRPRKISPDSPLVTAAPLGPPVQRHEARPPRRQVQPSVLHDLPGPQLLQLTVPDTPSTWPRRLDRPVELPPVACSPRSSPWDPTSAPSRKSSVLVPPTDAVLVRSAPLPTVGPWGFDTTSSTKSPRYLIVPAVDLVLVYPVGPSPIVNLPINVYIGGGTPRTEIVDGPTLDEIDSYYDDLIDEAVRLRRLVPDVLGKEEYERERRRRRAESLPPEPLRQTSCRFEPTLRPESCRRILMMVGDARSKGLGVDETDAFTLRYRPGVFNLDREIKMTGGCMVKLTASRPADLVTLAKLAKLHLYRLVTWTSDSLFLFDDTTLTPKVPPLAWWTLGAGWGLALGAELWRAPETLDVPEQIAQPKPKKNPGRRRRKIR